MLPQMMSGFHVSGGYVHHLRQVAYVKGIVVQIPGCGGEAYRVGMGSHLIDVIIVTFKIAIIVIVNALLTFNNCTSQHIVSKRVETTCKMTLDRQLTMTILRFHP